jgi:hypothetical protein
MKAVSWWPPHFEDYATTDTLTGPAAPIDYTLDPDIRRLRTQVEGARRGKADFAGHLTFVVWGCGTQCTSNVLLDLRTGRTYDDAQVNFSCGTVHYSIGSALVVTGPDTTEAPVDATCNLDKTHYFAWSGTGLVELQERR